LGVLKLFFTQKGTDNTVGRKAGKPHDQSEIILSDPSIKYGQYGAHGSFTYNDKTLYQG